jgi:hypothetical protein
VMSNPHPYYTNDVLVNHPEVRTEWIERALVNP